MQISSDETELEKEVKLKKGRKREKMWENQRAITKRKKSFDRM